MILRNSSGYSLPEPNAYMDNVSIITTLPAGLDNIVSDDAVDGGGLDGDHDDMADAEEMHLYGDLETHHIPYGTLFQFK